MRAKVKKENTRQRVVSTLAVLPEKNREILERRFGIGRDVAETLESIGRSRGITRERVRQIQEYGLHKLKREGAQKILAPTFCAIEEFIKENSGVVRESDLFKLVADSDKPHLLFAARLMPNLLYAQETGDLYARYALDRVYLNTYDEFLRNLHTRIGKYGVPMKFSDLLVVAKNDIPQDNLKMQGAVEQMLHMSKRIQQGPFGDYGLAEWPAIRPRGVRDKAHLVFEREKRPLHFRELSSLIDNYFTGTLLAGSLTSSRKTHPQTVHNELIKDSRFVLIGRGLYALSEWGYEPGTVKDILTQIFKEQGKSLSKEEVLDLISKRRFVKPNTVFLNLQNKHYFKKQKDEKYYLA